MRRPAFDRAELLRALYCLDVRPPVTSASLVDAYRRKVKANHPDRFRSDDQQRAATERLQEINNARDYINAHLTEALNFGADAPIDEDAGPLRWTREECVQACADYERIWPADPRD